ncbi:hypothetical protein H0A66_02250 [Alcaligenaceae bacterium]|nr:hypothetical protein [Alcaligenaceae bacterium]
MRLFATAGFSLALFLLYAPAQTSSATENGQADGATVRNSLSTPKLNNSLAGSFNTGRITQSHGWGWLDYINRHQQAGHDLSNRWHA